MESIHDLLEGHAAEWWVAEDPSSGDLVGYARSIERAGLFELTEFFVDPKAQSQGLGRALLERAFPVGRGDVRVIVATSEVSALSRYLRVDTVVRFPIFSMNRAPRQGAADGRLTSMVTADAVALEAARDIERKVLGYPRDIAELRWLAQHRELRLFQSGDRPVAFAFLGAGGAGPIAALDPADLPQVLATLERRASEMGLERIEFEVPAPNEAAMRYLLAEGFRFDPFVNYLLSNRPFGSFDRFLGFSPQFFL